MTCSCGDDGCERFACGYPFCGACGEHHRVPVGLEGERCPVDALMESYDRQWATVRVPFDPRFESRVDFVDVLRTDESSS